MGESATLTELGIDRRGAEEAKAPNYSPKTVTKNKTMLYEVVENEKDYYVEKDGVRFAGIHLLVDLWGASNLDDLKITEAALRRAAIDSGATILHCHLHHFTPNGGISGVLVLAESHISIHTWPERNYAALDLFMCGDCDPNDGIQALKEAFQPDTIDVDEQWRGIVPEGE